MWLSVGRAHPAPAASPAPPTSSCSPHSLWPSPALSALRSVPPCCAPTTPSGLPAFLLLRAQLRQQRLRHPPASRNPRSSPAERPVYSAAALVLFTCVSPALPLEDSPPGVTDLTCSRSCPQHTLRRARHATGLSKRTHGAWHTEVLDEHRRKNGGPAGSFPSAPPHGGLTSCAHLLRRLVSA